jgi:anti-sigma B factor antagonist
MTESVRFERRGRVLVIAHHGDLDLSARETLRAELPQPHDLADEGTNAVVVDLRAVTFMDCAALGVLMALTRECHQVGISVLLAGAIPIVRRLLTALRLDQVFVVTFTVEEAVSLAETWMSLGTTPPLVPPPPPLPFPAAPSDSREL